MKKIMRKMYVSAMIVTIGTFVSLSFGLEKSMARPATTAGAGTAGAPGRGTAGAGTVGAGTAGTPCKNGVGTAAGAGTPCKNGAAGAGTAGAPGRGTAGTGFGTNAVGR